MAAQPLCPKTIAVTPRAGKATTPQRRVTSSISIRSTGCARGPDATMLSVGVPMFVMGDEVRRSQRGNNDAYCQENDTSWFDWNLLAKHADVLRFVKLLIERRVIRDVEHERRRLSLGQVLREQEHAWHRVKLKQPDWSPFSHAVAIGGDLESEGILVHIIFNAYWEPLDFETSAVERRYRELVAVDRYCTGSAA
jgi:pullulanase/glycogen debranching enzyme